jgi:hypothetical protein
MAVSERQIVISGTEKYVPLTIRERESYLLEFWMTSLQGQEHPYVNYEWSPDRKFFGRFAFCSELYVVEEKLAHFSNELLAAFRADAVKLNENAQCAYIDMQRTALDAVAAQPGSAIAGIAIEKTPTAAAIAGLITLLMQTLVNLSGDPTGRLALINLLRGEADLPKSSLSPNPYRAITPRSAVGHPITGFFYSMSDSASAALTIRSYYNGDACFLPGTEKRGATDERQLPPATASGGELPGSPSGNPPSTGDGTPPAEGVPSPATPILPNPLPSPDRPGQSPDQTLPGVGYEIEYGYTLGAPVVVRATVLGKISGWQKVSAEGGQEDWFVQAGIGSAGGATRIVTVRSAPLSPFPNQRISGQFIRVIRRV